MREFRNPSSVHPPIAAYSHQVEITQPVRWLMLSGQLGRSQDGTVPEDPIRQLEVAFENIAHNLEAAQMNTGHLVKLTIYLVGEVDVVARRAVIKAFLGEHRPCVTMLFIAGLADPAYKVEIEAVACE